MSYDIDRSTGQMVHGSTDRSDNRQGQQLALARALTAATPPIKLKKYPR
jgi:hypothetical protein